MKVLLPLVVLIIFITVVVLVARWVLNRKDRTVLQDKADRQDLQRLRELESSLLKLSMEHMVSDPLALIVYDEITTSQTNALNRRKSS